MRGRPDNRLAPFDQNAAVPSRFSDFYDDVTNSSLEPKTTTYTHLCS